MNRSQKQLLVMALLGISALIVAPDIRASDWNKECLVNITEPIIAGNHVLAPGTYSWKLMNSSSNRQIVEITDQKTGQLETTILAIPAYRQVASSKVELQFWETPQGVPRAVQKWFYPGDNEGQEFLYPAKLVAKLQMQLASHNADTLETKTAAVVAPHQAKRAGNKQVSMAQSASPLKRPSVVPQGSWATIGPIPASPKQTSEKPHSGFWNGIKNLPLTATLAPLVGLVGLALLTLFVLSTKRKKAVILRAE